MGGYSRLDLDGEIDAIWGSSGDALGLFSAFAVSPGFSTAGNPLYSATDFFTQFPNFGGQATNITGGLTNASTELTNASSVLGLTLGLYIAGLGLQSGTTIAGVGVDGTTITLSQSATLTGSPIAFRIFTSPIIPTAVLNGYIALATNSLSSQLWGQLWPTAMGFFIAHYCTLWAQTQGRTATTASQVASQGLALGIKTSKSAGGVSASSTPLMFDGAGAYALTAYGQQFATWAQTIGSGSMLIL